LLAPPIACSLGPTQYFTGVSWPLPTICSPLPSHTSPPAFALALFAFFAFAAFALLAQSPSALHALAQKSWSVRTPSSPFAHCGFFSSDVPFAFLPPVRSVIVDGFITASS